MADQIFAILGRLMARNVPYVMCRYRMTVDDRPLSGREQLSVLEGIRGKLVVHRKADPTPDDADTLIMKPKAIEVNEDNVLTWYVGQQLSGKSETFYDKDQDELREEWSGSEAVRYARFVAIPRLGVVAISDRTGDNNINSSSAISRMKSIFRQVVRGGDIWIELAASHADAQRAIRDWSLARFDFDVRPFNPHPRHPGQLLSDLLSRDNIGTLRARATPKAGADMRANDGGCIEEAVGLAEAGYGQYGLRGTTAEGRDVALRKPKFDLDKVKNESIQRSPQQLRVYLEPQESELAEFAEAASALIEFYGGE